VPSIALELKFIYITKFVYSSGNKYGASQLNNSYVSLLLRGGMGMLFLIETFAC